MPPLIYCKTCGCKVGRRVRRKTKTAYYTHECPKGSKGTACGKLHVHFLDRLTPTQRETLMQGMTDLRRRFASRNKE